MIINRVVAFVKNGTSTKSAEGTEGEWEALEEALDLDCSPSQQTDAGETAIAGWGVMINEKQSTAN